MSVTPAEEVPDCHAAPFLVTEQLVTFEEVQEMTEVLPDCTRAGVAVIVAVGCSTVTVTNDVPEEPPGPVHVIEYVEVVDGLTGALPEVGPLEIPGILQDVALIEDQEIAVDCPETIVLGAAEIEAAGC